MSMQRVSAQSPRPNGPPRRPVRLDLDAELVTAVDTRALVTGLTRVAWIERVLRWALDQPVGTRVDPQPL